MTNKKPSLFLGSIKKFIIFVIHYFPLYEIFVFQFVFVFNLLATIFIFLSFVLISIVRFASTKLSFHVLTLLKMMNYY